MSEPTYECSQPKVCCIALTADRKEFTDRMIRCFIGQTYERKTLLIWDTGQVPYVLPEFNGTVLCVRDSSLRGKTIGELRNAANDFAKGYDILAHFDVDDWSYPGRIAEQVQQLQDSGKQAVGLREILFWDSTKSEAWMYDNGHPKYCVGTSLAYWRTAWEKHQFESTSAGED